MKKITLLAVLGNLACSVVCAQEPVATAQASPSLKPLKTLLDSLIVGTQWTLHFEHHSEEYAPKSRQVLAAEFAEYVKPGDKKDYEYRMQMKFHDAALKFLEAAPSLLGDSAPVFFGKAKDLVRFVEWSGTPCVVVPTVGVGTTYNTVKLDTRQRAERAASSVAIPMLVSLSKAFDGTTMECVGVGVAFASKNLVRAEMLDPRTEYLALVASRKDIAAYEKGELAQEQLLGKSAVFSQDRDDKFTVKRILLGVQP